MRRIQKITILTLFILPMFASCDTLVTSHQDTTSESHENTTSINDDQSSLTSEITTSDATSEVSTSDDSDDYPDQFAIYSINDTHGAIEEDTSSYSYVPGMANLDYCIKNDADYDKNYSVLLSAGDMSQGTGISNISKGQCMMECMNAMGIDAMTIGNHEFDWGVDTIQAMEETANFPFLGINIVNKDDGKIISEAQPSAIINKGNLKIGVVGSIYRYITNSISASMISDIKFVDDEPLVSAEVNRLKEEEKCDVVVVLTHQGEDASAVTSYMNNKDISGIFGGHDHRYCCDPSYDGHSYFLEAGSSSKAYSKLVLQKNQDGTYSVKMGSTLQIDQWDCQNASSPEIDSIVERYRALCQDVLDEVIGQRDGPLDRSRLGTLVTEAMMYYAEDVCQKDDIAVAVHNRGGIRSTLEGGETNDNGLYDITYDNIYQVMPFDNEVQYVELSGEKLIEACTSSYDYHSRDFSQDGSNYYLNGTEVDTNKTYKVLAIDYIITRDDNPCYQGGEPGTAIDGEIVYTRDLIKDYIKHLGVVNVSDFPSLVEVY